MKKYKISKEESANALLFSIIEVYGQNALMIEMMARILANQTGKPVKEVVSEFEKKFTQKKHEFQDLLYANFGQLDQDDILPSK